MLFENNMHSKMKTKIDPVTYNEYGAKINIYFNSKFKLCSHHVTQKCIL